jgi:heme/copper-type cytochrome/quinol oxidase subunit 3
MAEITADSLGHSSDTQVKAHNENLKLAVWLYLASEVVIFSIMIAGYIIFRFNEPQFVKNLHDTLGIGLVTANTFVLLASSWAMVMALRAIQMGNRQHFMLFMGLVVGMGTVFMIGQYIEYSELSHLAITLDSTTEEFGAIGMRFYAPTFFHGVHVFVGVLLGLQVMWLGRKGFYDKNPIGVELFGLYWHFVDVVWIMLFTLIYLV